MPLTGPRLRPVGVPPVAGVGGRRPRGVAPAETSDSRCEISVQRVLAGSRVDLLKRSGIAGERIAHSTDRCAEVVDARPSLVAQSRLQVIEPRREVIHARGDIVKTR